MKELSSVTALSILNRVRRLYNLSFLLFPYIVPDEMIETSNGVGNPTSTASVLSLNFHHKMNLLIEN
jgi:hypothetical protein